MNLIIMVCWKTLARTVISCVTLFHFSKRRRFSTASELQAVIGHARYMVEVHVYRLKEEHNMNKLLIINCIMLCISK